MALPPVTAAGCEVRTSVNWFNENLYVFLEKELFKAATSSAVLKSALALSSPYLFTYSKSPVLLVACCNEALTNWSPTYTKVCHLLLGLAWLALRVLT